jgi:hypothetical protein
LAQPGCSRDRGRVFDLDSGDDQHFALMGCDGLRR